MEPVSAKLTLEERTQADHVFTEDYARLELAQVYEHIDEFGHLPWIRSERQVQETGIDVLGNTVNLLESIENLYLRMRDMNRKSVSQRDSLLNTIESLSTSHRSRGGRRRDIGAAETVGSEKGMQLGWGMVVRERLVLGGLVEVNLSDEAVRESSVMHSHVDEGGSVTSGMVGELRMTCMICRRRGPAGKGGIDAVADAVGRDAAAAAAASTCDVVWLQQVRVMWYGCSKCV